MKNLPKSAALQTSSTKIVSSLSRKPGYQKASVRIAEEKLGLQGTFSDGPTWRPYLVLPKFAESKMPQQKAHIERFFRQRTSMLLA